MVDIGELEIYVSAKCCNTGDVIEVVSEGKIEPTETKYGMKNILNIPVKLNGKNMFWSPNRTARDQTAKLCKSTNTKDWVSKKFSVVVVDEKVIPSQLI